MMKLLIFVLAVGLLGCETTQKGERMSWPIAPTRYQAGAPGATGLFADIINQLSTVSGIAASSNYIGDSPVIPNGSFEQDVPTTVTPTGWVTSPIGTGSGQVTNTQQSHGAQSYLAIQPPSSGNGGMKLTLANPIPVSRLSGYHLRMSLMASGTGTQTTVTVTFLTNALATISTQVFTYNNPTTWQTFDQQLNSLIVGCCFIQIEIDLGVTGSIPSTTTDIYLDNVTTVANAPGELMSLASISGSGGGFTTPGGYNSARIVLNSVLSGNAGYIDAIAYVNPGTSISWTNSSNVITVSWFGPYGNQSITLNNGSASGTVAGVYSSGTAMLAGSSYLQVVW